MLCICMRSGMNIMVREVTQIFGHSVMQYGSNMILKLYLVMQLQKNVQLCEAIFSTA
jgi:hypothetical protein